MLEVVLSKGHAFVFEENTSAAGLVFDVLVLESGELNNGRCRQAGSVGNVLKSDVKIPCRSLFFIYIDELTSPVHCFLELGATGAGIFAAGVEGVGTVDEDDEIEGDWIVDIWNGRWWLHWSWAAETLASDSDIVELGFCHHGYSGMDVDSEESFKLGLQLVFQCLQKFAPRH